MWPYTNEESEWINKGSTVSVKDYVSKRVFDGIRTMTKEHANRLRKIITERKRS